MLEVADLIRLHEGAFRARFGSRLSSAQWRALLDLKACRTALLWRPSQTVFSLP